jgi:hypothetical protein
MFVPDGFPNEKWGILGTGFSFFAPHYNRIYRRET